MHGKGHQMMTFTVDCGPIVHVNATSQNSACVFVQGRQFTANWCTGMADLATVVSSGPSRYQVLRRYCLSRPAF